MSVSYVFCVKFAFGTKPNGGLPSISLDIFQEVSRPVFL